MSSVPTLSSAIIISRIRNKQRGIRRLRGGIYCEEIPIELFPFWKQFSSIKQYRTSAFGFWGIPGSSLPAVRIAAGAERNGPSHKIPS